MPVIYQQYKKLTKDWGFVLDAWEVGQADMQAKDLSKGSLPVHFIIRIPYSWLFRNLSWKKKKKNKED